MLASLDHLASIEPLALRVRAARERLLANGTVAAPQLEALLQAARRGNPRARKSLLACSIALVQDDGQPWVDTLMREARGQRLPALEAMSEDAPPHRAIRYPGRLPDPCVSATRAAMFASLSVKLRATHACRLPTERILAHPDPAVVRRLLRGPACRMGDALAIASRRPIAHAVVREIIGSLRWIARTEVREALAANPFVRPRVALLLLPTLLAPARKGLGRGSLHPLVRQAAAEFA